MSTRQNEILEKPAGQKTSLEKPTNVTSSVKAPVDTASDNYGDNKSSMTWEEFIMLRFTRVL